MQGAEKLPSTTTLDKDHEALRKAYLAHLDNHDCMAGTPCIVREGIVHAISAVMYCIEVNEKIASKREAWKIERLDQIGDAIIAMRGE